MARNAIRTSARKAATASHILSDGRYSTSAKSVAGSCLRNRGK